MGDRAAADVARAGLLRCLVRKCGIESEWEWEWELGMAMAMAMAMARVAVCVSPDSNSSPTYSALVLAGHGPGPGRRDDAIRVVVAPTAVRAQNEFRLRPLGRRGRDRSNDGRVAVAVLIASEILIL